MKTYAYVAGVSAILGALLAWYLVPTKTSTVVQERVVRKNDIRTVIKTVEKPGGVKETTTEIIDNTVLDASKSQKVIQASQAQYVLGLSAGTKLDDYKPVYGVHVGRRVIGPIFATIYGRTDAEFGLSVAIEF